MNTNVQGVIIHYLIIQFSERKIYELAPWYHRNCHSFVLFKFEVLCLSNRNEQFVIDKMLCPRKQKLSSEVCRTCELEICEKVRNVVTCKQASQNVESNRKTISNFEILYAFILLSIYPHFLSYRLYFITIFEFQFDHDTSDKITKQSFGEPLKTSPR